MPCSPPTIEPFDIDVYDCPCGHAYGEHEYEWMGHAAGPPHKREMRIIRCTRCPAPEPGGRCTRGAGFRASGGARWECGLALPCAYHDAPKARADREDCK